MPAPHSPLMGGVPWIGAVIVLLVVLAVVTSAIFVARQVHDNTRPSSGWSSGGTSANAGFDTRDNGLELGEQGWDGNADAQGVVDADLEVELGTDVGLGVAGSFRGGKNRYAHV